MFVGSFFQVISHAKIEGATLARHEIDEIVVDYGFIVHGQSKGFLHSVRPEASGLTAVGMTIKRYLFWLILAKK